MLASARSPQNVTGRYVLTCKKKQNDLAVEKVVEGVVEITTNIEKTSAKSIRVGGISWENNHMYVIFSPRCSIALSPHKLSPYISFVSISIAIHFSVSNLAQLCSHLQTLTMWISVQRFPRVEEVLWKNNIRAKLIALCTHTKSHYIASLKQST